MANQELMGLINTQNMTNQEARNCLKNFYKALKDAKKTDEYIWDVSSEFLSSYTTYVPYIYYGLLKKDYHNVCDILSSILYFNNKSGRVFQKRDKYALLLLLEGEFKNEEDT